MIPTCPHWLYRNRTQPGPEAAPAIPAKAVPGTIAGWVVSLVAEGSERMRHVTDSDLRDRMSARKEAARWAAAYPGRKVAVCRVIVEEVSGG